MRASFRRLFKTVLLNNMKNELAFEEQRILVMMNAIILCGSLFLLLLSFISLHDGLLSLAVLDFVMIPVFLGHYAYIFITKKYKGVALIGCTLILLYFLILFVIGAAHHQAFVWFYSFPVITLFLLGSSLGAAFSVALIIGVSIINVSGPLIPFFSPYPDGLVMRIVLSYTLVLIFSFIFERTRVMMQQKLERAMGDLNERAIRDSLTGLHNRRYMDEILDSVILQRRRSGQTLALMMIDLDYFKLYNDTYGHVEGDEVLNRFAAVLNSLVRRKSDYVFRYGGEEFAMLLSPTNLETAESFSQKIIDEVNNLAMAHKQSPFGVVTVSVGVAVSVAADEHAGMDSLIRFADKALYRAKSSGRNRYEITLLASSSEE